jgi:hypothetical protein
MHHVVRQMGEIMPDTGRGRPWALPFADRALLVVLAYRTDLTMQQLGSLCGSFHAGAHRALSRLAQPLAELLGPPPTDRRERWIVDGTPIPVHDQQRTANSNNHRRSVHVQIVCHAKDRRVIAVGDTWPGNRNDVVVYRETLGKNARRPSSAVRGRPLPRQRPHPNATPRARRPHHQRPQLPPVP